MKYILMVLALSSMTLVSCSKDPVSTIVVQSANPKLLVVPGSLHGATYTDYTFKARVNGMAESDVYLNWDFGSADVVGPRKHQIAAETEEVVFSAAGTFAVRVDAFDNFTDTIIDSYSFNAVIDSAPRSVDLLPNSTSFAVLTRASGGPFDALMVKATVNASTVGFQYLFHISGPQMDSFVLQRDSVLSIQFQNVGSYHTSVQVIDAQGKFYAADSSDYLFTILKPDVAKLQQLRTLSIFVIEDTMTKKDSNGASTFAPTLVKSFSPTVDPGQLITWSGTSFSGNYANHTKTFSSYRDGTTDIIDGVLSPDLGSITSVQMTFHDSNFMSPNSFVGSRDWGGTANGLQLVANTPTAVIYAVRGAHLADILSGFFYTTVGNMSMYDIRLETTAADQMDFNAANHPSTLPGVFVIFSK